MPYDEAIDQRVARLVSRWKKLERKKIFGGVCYLLGGDMVCGVHREFLILRLGPKGAEEALRGRHTRPFDVSGRPMKNWIMVEKAGFRTDDELREWLEEARDFVRTLPGR